MLCNSWIIVSKATGKPVLETYSTKVVNAINLEKYEVFTALAWLQNLNRRAKTA